VCGASGQGTACGSAGEIATHTHKHIHMHFWVFWTRFWTYKLTRYWHCMGWRPLRTACFACFACHSSHSMASYMPMGVRVALFVQDGLVPPAGECHIPQQPAANAYSVLAQPLVIRGWIAPPGSCLCELTGCMRGVRGAGVGED